MYGRKPYSAVPYSDVSQPASAVVAVPFSQTDWSPARSPPNATQQNTLYYNLALLTAIAVAPFYQTDWPKAVTPPLVTANQVAFNPNLFKNPLPFAQLQWVATQRLISSPPQLQPYNDNLFKNPIPLSRADWSSPWHVSDVLPPHPAQNNILLSSVQQAPFSRLDWSSSWRTPDFLPAAQPYNINIYSEVPFDQSDWSKPQKPGVPPPQAQPYNVNIYSAVPSYQSDWLRPRILYAPPATPVVPNVALLSLLSTPFAQLDWSRTSSPSAAAPLSQPLNINLFTNPIPFSQFDWSKPANVASLAPAPISINIGLSTAIVQSPFHQTDWPVSIRLRGKVQEQLWRNVNLFSEVPFYSTDWSRLQPRTLVASAAPYNVALYAAVPAPFAQIDWSKPFFPKPATPSASSLNVNLFTNPLPFAFSDKIGARTVAAVPPAPQPLNLSLSITVVANPFAQYDWPMVRPLKAASRDATQPFNLNFYVSSFPLRHLNQEGVFSGFVPAPPGSPQPSIPAISPGYVDLPEASYRLLSINGVVKDG